MFKLFVRYLSEHYRQATKCHVLRSKLNCFSLKVFFGCMEGVKLKIFICPVYKI